MSRTVIDAATLLGVITGVDLNDDKTKESKNRYHNDYTKFLDKNGLNGKGTLFKISIPKTF